jgi:hypothetical protein
MWLMNNAKKSYKDVAHLWDGVKDYLCEMHLPFLFSFLQRCFDMQQQTSKYLIQALSERINRSIDFNPNPILVSKVIEVEAI